MLDSLFVTASASAVIEALGSALRSANATTGDRRIAVVGNARLAAALLGAKVDDGDPLDVIPVGLSARAAKRFPRAVASIAALLGPEQPSARSARIDAAAPEPSARSAPIDDAAAGARSLAAVVGVDVATDDAWVDTIAAWSRVVRDGGAIVFVDRGHAAEASRRALCAGLGELEQRTAGRSTITSGLVTHL